MNLNKQNLINKIRYRSQYRGTKEMDIFTTSLVNALINDLSDEELEDLDSIINLNDEDLLELSNGKKIDLKIKSQTILSKIIDFKRKY